MALRPIRLDPHRDLVVLRGGPMSGQWFYADEFAARQRATMATLNEHSPAAAGACLHYQPTGRREHHPHAPGDGEILMYRGRQ